MPLQLREIGFHVENHATQWHGFQHEIQFQEIVVAWIQLTLKLMVQGLVCMFFWNRKGLVIIFKNILGLLERCRGLFIIKFKWWMVCLQKGETGRAFWKRVRVL